MAGVRASMIAKRYFLLETKLGNIWLVLYHAALSLFRIVFTKEQVQTICVGSDFRNGATKWWTIGWGEQKQ